MYRQSWVNFDVSSSVNASTLWTPRYELMPHPPLALHYVLFTCASCVLMCDCRRQEGAQVARSSVENFISAPKHEKQV